MTYSVLIGDCIESMRGLPDQCVNMCVTSPPYFGLRDYGMDGQIGLEATPDAFVARLVDVFREVRRVLRDDGTLWLNLGDSYAAACGGTHQPAETLAGGKGGKAADGAKVNRDRHDGYNPTRNAPAIGLKHKDLIGIPWKHGRKAILCELNPEYAALVPDRVRAIAGDTPDMFMEAAE